MVPFSLVVKCWGGMDGYAKLLRRGRQGGFFLGFVEFIRLDNLAADNLRHCWQVISSSPLLVIAGTVMSPVRRQDACRRGRKNVLADNGLGGENGGIDKLLNRVGPRLSLPGHLI